MLTVSAGGASISGNTTIIGSGTLNVAGTTTSGGMLTVSAGGASIYGNVAIIGSGTLNVAGTTTSGGMLTVSSGGATITGNSSVTGTFTSSQALTVSSGGANITGTTTSSGKLTVLAGGADITGLTTTGAITASGLITANGGLTITGNFSTPGTFTSGQTLTVQSGGASIIGPVSSSAAVQCSSGSSYMGGSLAVGKTGGASYTLDVNGTIAATVDIGISSDERLKRDIEDISNSLEMVKKMRGVYFKRTNDESNKRYVGVIAQEIEQILPEVVSTDQNGEKYKMVTYQNIIGVLIETIKELDNKLTNIIDKNNLVI